MNPFLRALVAAGLLDQATAERMSRALSPEQAQAYAEQRMAALWSGGLQGQLSRLLDVIRDNDYNLPPQVAEAFWRRENRTLFESVIPGLEDVAQEAAITAAMRGGGASMWTAVNERLISWVDDYYISADAGAFGSIPNLNDTARTIVGNAFNAWQRGELEVAANAEGLPQLIAALEPAFGPERASRIAVTETTRIHAEAELAAALADPDIEYIEWQTGRDEFVCPVCAPLNGRRVEKGNPAGFQSIGGPTRMPPAHVNCRCGTVGLTGPAAQAIDERAGKKPDAPKLPPAKFAGTFTPRTPQPYYENGIAYSDLQHVGDIGNTAVVVRTPQGGKLPSSADFGTAIKDVENGLRLLPADHVSSLPVIRVDYFPNSDSLREFILKNGTPPNGGMNARTGWMQLTWCKGEKLWQMRQGTVVHEVGHYAANAVTDDGLVQKWCDAVGVVKPDGMSYIDLFRGHKYDANISARAVTGPTAYGSTNVYESWAETYRLLFDPDNEDGQHETLAYSRRKYAGVADKLIPLAKEMLGL